MLIHKDEEVSTIFCSNWFIKALLEVVENSEASEVEALIRDANQNDWQSKVKEFWSLFNQLNDKFS